MEKKNFNSESLQELVSYLCKTFNYEFWHETDTVLALKSNSTVISSAVLDNVRGFGFECFCAITCGEIHLNICKSESL